jgi:hypothetical protein
MISDVSFDCMTFLDRDAGNAWLREQLAAVASFGEIVTQINSVFLRPAAETDAALKLCISAPTPIRPKKKPALRPA